MNIKLKKESNNVSRSLTWEKSKKKKKENKFWRTKFARKNNTKNGGKEANWSVNKNDVRAEKN